MDHKVIQSVMYLAARDSKVSPGNKTELHL